MTNLKGGIRVTKNSILKSLSLGVTLALALVAFQNCSPSAVSVNESSSEALKGNGDVYGGKAYITILEQGECADGTQLDSLISAENDQYLLVREKCTDMNPSVPIPTEEVKVIRQGLVYKDRIYAESGGLSESASTDVTQAGADAAQTIGKLACSGYAGENSSSEAHPLTSIHFNMEAYLFRGNIFFRMGDLRFLLPDTTKSQAGVYRNFNPKIEEVTNIMSEYDGGGIMHYSVGTGLDDKNTFKEGSLYLNVTSDVGLSGSGGSGTGFAHWYWADQQIGSLPRDFDLYCLQDGAFFRAVWTKSVELKNRSL